MAKDPERMSFRELQEFELKIYGRHRVGRQLGARIGFGLSARYMNVIHGQGNVDTFTTPSAIATLGFDIYMSERVSVGLDVNGRSAMISETPSGSGRVSSYTSARSQPGGGGSTMNR